MKFAFSTNLAIIWELRLAMVQWLQPRWRISVGCRSASGYTQLGQTHLVVDNPGKSFGEFGACAYIILYHPISSWSSYIILCHPISSYIILYHTLYHPISIYIYIKHYIRLFIYEHIFVINICTHVYTYIVLLYIKRRMYRAFQAQKITAWVEFVLDHQIQWIGLR